MAAPTSTPNWPVRRQPPVVSNVRGRELAKRCGAVDVGRHEHEVRVEAAGPLVHAVSGRPDHVPFKGGARADVVRAAIAEEDLPMGREGAARRNRDLHARGRGGAASAASSRLGVLPRWAGPLDAVDRNRCPHSLGRPVGANLRRRFTILMWHIARLGCAGSAQEQSCCGDGSQEGPHAIQRTCGLLRRRMEPV